MQLNSVPVIVYNKEWLPFKDTIDWKSFCILVHENEIDKLKEKLLNITDQHYEQMLNTGKQIYNEYFTMEGMSNNILKTLQAL